jgi:transporter family protein
MGWIGYSVSALVSLAVWGLLSKIALRHASWAQAVFVFGVATVLVLGVAVASRGERWTWPGIWLSSVTGVIGVVGFIFYYLALEKGRASAVVPVIGIYPALTALLAVVFLSESLTALQALGVVLALGGAVLIGVGA